MRQVRQQPGPGASAAALDRARGDVQDHRGVGDGEAEHVDHHQGSPLLRRQGPQRGVDVKPGLGSAGVIAVLRRQGLERLAAAGWQPRTPLLLDDACAGTWLRVRAGHVTVACTIASMSGVAGLIAIALATWPIAARVGPPAMAAGGGGVCDMPVAANGSGPDAATRSLTLRATRTAGGKSRS